MQTGAMNKDAMVDVLGEPELLLPARLHRGLAANDRVKYYLTLLQAARQHAAQPDQPVANLHGERAASGVDDDWLDGVVERSRPAAGDIYVPAAQQILKHLFAELELMLQPLRSAGAVAPDLAAAIATYARRLAQLRADAPTGAADRLPPAAVDLLTHGGDAASDSVHRLTIDLHKELNRLQALVADDVIDGAHAYGLGAAERRLVAAFMKGVAETSPLTFGHPGLTTTAARVGARLSIQTEIGTSDAHVVIVHTEGLTATVIYTDVHRSRVAFLREMLASFAVEWRDGTAPAGRACVMVVGTFTAHDAGELARFLTFFGSRLSFLIDWKRAQGSLARLVKKSDAAAVLRWAAEHGVGHCAFLQVDGARLVARAFEAAVSRARASSLSAVLGREETRNFLSEVMRITSEGLRAGRSTTLMQDEVEAELLRHVQPDGAGLIGAAAEHAVYISALAERLRHVCVRVAGSLDGEVARTAELAKMWEARADEIVRRWNRSAGRDSRPFSQLIFTADKAADALEDAAYLLTLVPPARLRDGLAALADLPELVSRSAKEYVRCLDYARPQGSNRTPADVDAMLVAVDRIATLEHHCDEAERGAEARLIQSAANFRDLHVLSRLVHTFEQAADALAWCAALVRKHVLSGDDAGARA